MLLDNKFSNTYFEQCSVGVSISKMAMHIHSSHHDKTYYFYCTNITEIQAQRRLQASTRMILSKFERFQN